MSQYAHFRDARTRDLCDEAESWLYEAPLLALLRARQAYEREGVAFDSGWQRIIHGREGLLDRPTEQQAALAALRQLHGALPKAPRPWRAPALPPEREGSLDDLVARYAELEARVNRTGPRSTEGAVGLADVDQQLRRARKDRGKLVRSGLAEDHQLLLRLWERRIERAIANHQGTPLIDDEEEAELVARGLRSANATLWAAIELANMRCIAQTHSFAFEVALQGLEGLVERFAGTDLLDERLGRLLGSLGQIYGFLAHEHEDPDFAELSDETFAEARRHFEAPDDLLRQDVYRVHAAVEGVRQGGDWRERLQERLEALEPQLAAFRRGEAVGRSDYALAAWLKGRLTLGEPVREAPSLAQAWRARIPDPARIAHEGMNHGMVVASGWLLLASPDRPRWLRELLDAVARRGGLVPWIARAFLVDGDEQGRHVLTDTLPPQARDWWERAKLAERAGRAIDLVPFNFA